MDREAHLKNYYALKEKLGLKEYIFMTRSGYRHKFVLGKNLKDAEETFMKLDVLARNGFELDDFPIRLEYKPDTMKKYTIEDFWNKNENHRISAH